MHSLIDDIEELSPALSVPSSFHSEQTPFPNQVGTPGGTDSGSLETPQKLNRETESVDEVFDSLFEDRLTEANIKEFEKKCAIEAVMVSQRPDGVLGCFVEGVLGFIVQR